MQVEMSIIGAALHKALGGIAFTCNKMGVSMEADPTGLAAIGSRCTFYIIWYFIKW